MAVTLVQESTQTGGTPWSASASATTTFPGNATPGNVIFVVFGINANEVVVDVTDDGANGSSGLYSTDAGLTVLNATAGVEMWTYWAVVTNAADVVTVELDSTNAAEGYIKAWEFSGLNTSDLLEDSSQASFTVNTNDLNSGPVTTTVNDSLIIAHWFGTPGTYDDEDYTTEVVDHSLRDAIVGYKILTATDAAETWNLSAGGGGEIGSNIIAAFNGTASGRTTKNTRAFPLGMEIGMNRGIGDN